LHRTSGKFPTGRQTSAKVVPADTPLPPHR
jgi:hypothetical protein